MKGSPRLAISLLAGAAAVLVAGILLVLLVFPGWDGDRPKALDDRQAEAMATRELIRWSRKTDSHSSEQQIVGVVCLVARTNSAGNKQFVFEFTRKDMTPTVRAVYVSSSSDDLEINVTSVAPRDANGRSTQSGYVLNCGK